MAKQAGNGGRKVSGLGSARTKLPTKRSINLASAGVKNMNISAAVIGIVLIVAAAALFGKFAVADRLIAVNREEQKVSDLKRQLSDIYKIIAEYGEIEADYAHYTWSGMTEEELALVSRPELMSIIKQELQDRGDAVSWRLSGNILTLTVTGDSLQEINEMARRLEEYDLISLCTVTTATKDERGEGGRNQLPAGKVRANIIAYLENAEEGAGK